MSDVSDRVAGDVLVLNAQGTARGSGLLLKPRAPWVSAVMFGSWGVLIAVPTTMLWASDGLPPRWVPAVGVTLVGYALLYAAVRAVVNRASVTVVSGELRFSRGPLWPFRARRFRLADVRGVRFRERQPSFLHPARHRGYPMPQPYFVELELADGASARLPTTLGLGDATAVARFIQAQL